MAKTFEEPKFLVISTEDGVETRVYEPKLVAYVEVKGTRDQALRAGFQILADYIFGNNRSVQKIAMTSPVEQSETIAMTSPVEQSAQGEGVWKVGFILPSQYQKENAPIPNDPRVMLEQTLPETYLVIGFSGFGTSRKFEAQIKRLEMFMAQRQIKATGQPKTAIYDPPWTLPFLRRNEVMIPIAPLQK